MSTLDTGRTPPLDPDVEAGGLALALRSLGMPVGMLAGSLGLERTAVYRLYEGEVGDTVGLLPRLRTLHQVLGSLPQASLRWFYMQWTKPVGTTTLQALLAAEVLDPVAIALVVEAMQPGVERAMAFEERHKHYALDGPPGLANLLLSTGTSI